MAQSDSLPTGNVTAVQRDGSYANVAPPGNVTPGSSTAPATRLLDDPIPAFQFHVEIDGIIEAGFTECKGLGFRWKVMQVKEGGVNNYVHQLPERVEYSKVTLKRGVALSPALWEWCRQGMYDGRVVRRNVSIILFDGVGEELREVKRWDLQGAYPVNWKGANLKADSKRVAIETLELAHHGVTLNEG